MNDPIPVIVALDVPDLDDAIDLAVQLEGEVGYFKVGLELFGAHGPEAVRRIAVHGPVMLDLKLHDIPTTVGRAAHRLGALGVALLTVHAAGGTKMVEAAVDGLADGARGAGAIDVTPRVLGVTVLTSMSDDDLASVNAPPARTQAPHLASVAIAAGAPGLVCAPRDVAAVREVAGGDVLVVTPGVRPATTAVGHDDHARAATPAEALAAGADLLVVGRPITRAHDPVAAARAVRDECRDARRPAGEGV